MFINCIFILDSQFIFQHLAIRFRLIAVLKRTVCFITPFLFHIVSWLPIDNFLQKWGQDKISIKKIMISARRGDYLYSCDQWVECSRPDKRLAVAASITYNCQWFNLLLSVVFRSIGFQNSYNTFLSIRGSKTAMMSFAYLHLRPAVLYRWDHASNPHESSIFGR